MQDPDLAELERRITAAMERISRAVETLAAPEGVPQAEHDRALSLAEARGAVAAAAEARAAAAEGEIQRLKEALEAETTANAQLRERNAALKTAKEAAQARAEELENALSALAETRAADRAELDRLIGALEPLVEEHPHA